MIIETETDLSPDVTMNLRVSTWTSESFRFISWRYSLEEKRGEFIASDDNIVELSANLKMTDVNKLAKKIAGEKTAIMTAAYAAYAAGGAA